MRTTLLVPLVLLCVACGPENPKRTALRMSAEVATARGAIAAANRHWMTYVAAGQADSVGRMYAANARLMGPNAPTAVGRAAITQAYGQMMQIGSWSIRLHTDSVWANGPLVIETGKWISTFKPGPHAPPMDTTDRGKYMARWIQEDGRWVMADDIYNSDQMPAPPPAAKKR